MTTATAQVKTTIELKGSGNAAELVERTQRSLDGLDKSAASSKAGVGGLSSAFSAFGKEGGEAAGDVEKGLLGIRDMVGKLPAPLANVADAFGGAEKILKVLPGPIGLVGAGIVAAGAAAYLLNKNLAETEARVRALGDASTRDLADSLDVSVVQAIKLQQGLGDLPAKLRPTAGLLDTVRKRAEAMGLDGAAAQTKLLDALGKGPEAIKTFEREFGRLSAAAGDLPDIAKRLGLSTEALGIAKQIGNEGERAKAAAEQATTLERLRQALAAEAAQASRAAGEASSRDLLTANAAALVAHERAATAKVLVDRAVEEANSLQEVVEKQRAAQAAESQRAQDAALHTAEIGLHEAQAALAIGNGARARAQSVVLAERGAELARQMVALQASHTGGLVAEAKFRAEIIGLQTSVARNDAAKQALAKQAAADAKAAGDRQRARTDAEIAAEIKLAKVRADAAAAAVLPTGVLQARRRVLALEEAAEVEKATRATNTARGRELAILAIEADFAAKRKALDNDVAENEKKLADENEAALRASGERSKAIAVSAAAAVASAAKARSASVIASLRLSGDEERADEAELAQVRAETADARSAIVARAIAETEGWDQASADFAEREKQRVAELAEAQLRLDDAEAAIALRRSQRLRERVASAFETSTAGPAGLLRQMGGESAKVGEALSGVASGAAVVARNWGDIGKAAPGAISAFGSVALALVDGERTKAGILAGMETAAAVAAGATGDIVGAAGHGAAAVLYGGIAVGAIGGGRSVAAPAAGPGGFSASAQLDSGHAQTGRGSSTVININTPLTSRQDVAKGISSGLRSLKTTGYAQSAGA